MSKILQFTDPSFDPDSMNLWHRKELVEHDVRQAYDSLLVDKELVITCIEPYTNPFTWIVEVK